ncbi:hypothetical protein L0U85_04115 [Glycomyces sp. L485]|uniref:hypothetical protein n=1 Tax=Glycomyces sp. L485 TaxID=2909235 RepID=UPI001F4B2527|nr:hypothetical protein [Glycomyces sp. L485]MCH7230047.1 hypothetical protein [Glycomyces sp. L485]
MESTLRNRRYRVAARLSAELASTFGLWTTAALAALLLAEWVVDLASAEPKAYANLVFTVLPFVVAAVGWVYLYRSFPAAVISGITRRELLISYALFGAVVVVGSALLVQAGVFVQDRITGTASLFYGRNWTESLIRPLVYFAAGAAAGAVSLRFGLGRLTGLLFAVLLLRQIPIALSSSDGATVLLSYPSPEVMLAPLDVALAAVFLALTWAVLRRAPMSLKKA